MLDVPVLMSTLSTLPALFKHPRRDAKREKEAAFKGSIWRLRIFHWCIVTGDFPSSPRCRGRALKLSQMSVSSQIQAPVLMSAALLAVAAACSWSWMLRQFWHSDSNDNDFYGDGINNRWAWWLKKKLQVHKLYRRENEQKATLICFPFAGRGFKKENDEISLNMPTYKTSLII